MDEQQTAPSAAVTLGLKPDQVKVVYEVALDEFERFADAMDIDIDVKGMDPEDNKTFHDSRRVLLRSMMRGDLVINSDGEPVFTPRKGVREPITFHEPTGSTYAARDKRKDSQRVAGGHAMLAEMTRQPPTRFDNMRKSDYVVVSAIAGFLLG